MQEIVLAALQLGAFTGLHSFTPLAVVCWATKLKWLSLAATPFAFFGSNVVIAVATFLAVGELIGDKLPWIPNRTTLLPLAGRMTMATLCALALCFASGTAPAWPIGAAILGAVAAALAGFYLRRALTSRAQLPDLLVAAVEDLIAVGGSFLVLAHLGNG